MKNISISNNSLDEDISIAIEKIENGHTFLSDDIFDDSSTIYRISNETISHKPYVDAIKNKEKVLAITASGDQILNSIFLNGKYITGIDISRFPKYFAALKLTSLMSLSKDDFLQFIVGDKNNPPLSKELYNKVRNNLSDDVKEFWDKLFSLYDEEKINSSSLFRQFNISKSRYIANNPFLQKDNYECTKNKLTEARIDLCDKDIFSLTKKDFGTFDLIYLSNIINYYMMDKSLDEMSEHFKEFVKRLPLNNDGNAVIYNFTLNGHLEDFFKEKGFSVHLVKEDLINVSITNEIIVYNKPRKLSLFR